MITLNADQTAILASDALSVNWLFTVIDKNSNRYLWSTKKVTDFAEGTIWGEVIDTEGFGFEEDKFGFEEDGTGFQSGQRTLWALGPEQETFGFESDDSYGFEADAPGFSARERTLWEGGSGEGTEYAFNIVRFDGVELFRPLSEVGLQSPNRLKITIGNQDNIYTPSDFETGQIWLALTIANSTDTEVFYRWRFRIRTASPAYQVIAFECEDYYSQFMEGDWPNGKLVKDIFVSDDPDISDNVCVPVPFGTCYIPLRSIFTNDNRSYFLGPITVGGTAVTYSISRVRSPRSMGSKSEWTSLFYSFNQFTQQAVRTDIEDFGFDGDSFGFGSDETGFNVYEFSGGSWRLFQPIIADADNDGTVDSIGTWKSGESFLDMPTQFSRSDTAGYSSPANWIDFILKDFGITADNINAVTIAAAATTFASWGLTFIGGFWVKKSRQQILSELLNMCHSTLKIGEQVEVHVLSTTSQKTLTKADIKKNAFKYRSIIQKLPDSGFVQWQQPNEAQETFLKTLVPAKSTTDEVSKEIFPCNFVQNSIYAQNLASMYFQKKFLKSGMVSFIGMPGLLVLQPDDMITINHADYGGTYDVLVDSMKIKKDLSIELSCTAFSSSLDDWEDLSFSAISVTLDATTGVWNPVVAGPPSTLDTNPNEVQTKQVVTFLGDDTNPAALAFKGTSTTTQLHTQADGESLSFTRTSAGTLNFLPYQNDSLADDGTVSLPNASAGMVMVSCNGEAGMWVVETDGSVTKASGSANTADTDSDTDLCVFQSGTQAIVKNRLGAVGEIRIFYFHN